MEGIVNKTNRELWSEIQTQAGQDFVKNKWNFLACRNQATPIALRASLLCVRMIEMRHVTHSNGQLCLPLFEEFKRPNSIEGRCNPSARIPPAVGDEFIDKCFGHSNNYYICQPRSWLEDWNWLPQEIKGPKPVRNLYMEAPDLDSFDFERLMQMHPHLDQLEFYSPTASNAEWLDRIPNGFPEINIRIPERLNIDFSSCKRTDMSITLLTSGAVRINKLGERVLQLPIVSHFLEYYNLDMLKLFKGVMRRYPQLLYLELERPTASNSDWLEKIPNQLKRIIIHDASKLNTDFSALNKARMQFIPRYGGWGAVEIHLSGESVPNFQSCPKASQNAQAVYPIGDHANQNIWNKLGERARAFAEKQWEFFIKHGKTTHVALRAALLCASRIQHG